jgi:hypothetical protein
LKPEKTGQLHWRCKSGYSEGAFDVVSVAPEPEKPLALPMADQIAHLIEKSAIALEGLRQQFHP